MRSAALLALLLPLSLSACLGPRNAPQRDLWADIPRAHLRLEPGEPGRASSTVEFREPEWRQLPPLQAP
jgi:hypothetical protein